LIGLPASFGEQVAETVSGGANRSQSRRFKNGLISNFEILPSRLLAEFNTAPECRSGLAFHSPLDYFRYCVIA
jgi:hypothetical protein